MELQQISGSRSVLMKSLLIDSSFICIQHADTLPSTPEDDILTSDLTSLGQRTAGPRHNEYHPAPGLSAVSKWAVYAFSAALLVSPVQALDTYARGPVAGRSLSSVLLFGVCVCAARPARRSCWKGLVLLVLVLVTLAANAGVAQLLAKIAAPEKIAAVWARLG
ncbi:hypothetical protein EDC01DRAFT_86395 [Geopyxis carbonaria]|nr:hypothetical protein EDC01DRAFT_86395 [Geopyxis carbonaria]